MSELSKATCNVNENIDNESQANRDEVEADGTKGNEHYSPDSKRIAIYECDEHGDERSDSGDYRHIEEKGFGVWESRSFCGARSWFERADFHADIHSLNLVV